ncbi:MAG: aminoacyl-tRNA hydrolase [Phycisphaeraceae bacterium]|nr:aminoacyl-tRNA hydrolase [Phycisphaeraceae bacterium]
MKLIAGLGNPGAEYVGTRHNTGYMVIDELSQRHGLGGDDAAKSQFQALVHDAHLGGERVTLLKPITFINRSGQSIRQALDFYKLDPAEDLLVIVDDIALPAGEIRLRGNGGAGGHNGLKDIERAVSGQDYPRLRIGIDPPGRVKQVDYVLGRFTSKQRDQLEPALVRAADAVEAWITDGLDTAMNRFN